VLTGDGGYEVVLDHRKLKTPKGAPFVVRSEPLAIAVATEFDNQKEHIERSRMHLSALCFTAIDNPNHLSKLDMVNYLLNYIATDTVLYQYDVGKPSFIYLFKFTVLCNPCRTRRLCTICRSTSGIR